MRNEGEDLAMIAKEIERRQVGRPRTYDDAEVFLATAGVLARNGHSGLTLAAVAADLGCTAPALNNRFGSKGDLLIAFLEWSTALAQDRFDQVRAEHQSPLAALRARFAMPAEDRQDEMTAPLNYGNLVTLAFAAASDPVLRPILARRRHLFEDQIGALLRDARAAGELIDCDTRKLAWVLFAALTGTAHLMALGHPGQTIEDQLGAMVDDVIAPYRT